MARRRFFVHEIRNRQAELEGDEARHLTQVLRVEAGQRYEISDNQSLYLAEVETARKQHVVFRILENLPEPQPSIPISLFLSLIKFERLELILEKATELGVTAITFVDADRTEKGLERAVEKRLPRWSRIVLESSQQSRRAKLPVLALPLSTLKALAGEAPVRLFLDEIRTGAPILAAIPASAPAVSLMIGPEGGWTDAERAAAATAGWTSVSLGENILRTETAAIAALAVVNAALGR
ncbi:MAG TPA: RsmE family RNA methyltransferase [Bryobacteraceae bacterium]|nr:RsmE family RNA methyltransferase [Bryobacteraceae bacterium]